jgi:hypothetical protein
MQMLTLPDPLRRGTINTLTPGTRPTQFWV